MNPSWRLGVLEGALRVLDRMASGKNALLATHLETGLRGEDAAFFYLQRKGMTVVARRWSATGLRGDVDLIAWDGQVLCFVEVKARTRTGAAHAHAAAEAAVDEDKRRMLRRLAWRYLKRLPESALSNGHGPAVRPAVRFDVASVYFEDGKSNVLHFPGAFGWNSYGNGAFGQGMGR